MNIKDIAKIAGVSTATVSYALNGNDKISEETRENIFRIIKKVGYVPSGIARDLKKKKINVIGVFLDSVAGSFYAELIEGIQKKCNELKYNFIILTSLGNNTSMAYKYLEERRVDGGILFTPNFSDSFILDVAQKGTPLVLLDRELEKDNICSIVLDNESGIKQAVRHLKSIGRTKIGFLSGKEMHYDNIMRLKGYTEGLIEENIFLSKKWQFKGDFSEICGYRTGKKIAEMSERPEAIISANDEMAIGLIRALHEENINVPNDISVVGFDNIKLSQYITPTLTTISHPKIELGIMAVETLIGIIQNKKMLHKRVLPTKLIKRESCLNKIECIK